MNIDPTTTELESVEAAISATVAKMREMAANQDDPGGKAFYQLQAEIMPGYIRWITTIGVHLTVENLCQAAGCAAVSMCLETFTNAADGAEMTPESVLRFLAPIVLFQMQEKAAIPIGQLRVPVEPPTEP